MAPPQQFTETLKKGYCRGTYTADIHDPNLLMGKHFEGNIFEIAGYKWRVVACRCPSTQEPREVLKVFFVSCNDEKIRAHVSYSVSIEQDMLAQQSSRVLRIACPFAMIDEIDVPIESFMTESQDSLRKGDVRVFFDLKNVRAAGEDDQPGPTVNTRTVELEILDRQSIEMWLRGCKLGIATLSKEREIDMFNCSLVRSWAQSQPNYRYWLCKRTDNGAITVNKSFNEMGVLDTFGSSCQQDNGKELWVTVFRENKNTYESFQPVDDDTIIVFCKLWERPRGCLSYLGHLFVKKTALCSNLTRELMDMVGSIQDRGNCGLYLEERYSELKDITRLSSTLRQGGMVSGSVVILRTWLMDNTVPVGADLQRLLYSYEAPARVDYDFSNELSLSSSVQIYPNSDTEVYLDQLPIVNSFPLSLEPVLSDNEAPEVDEEVARS